MRNDLKREYIYKRSSLTIKQKVIIEERELTTKTGMSNSSFPEKIKIKAPRLLQVIVRREVVTREALNKFRK